ncbi:MAG: MBL fold metallo-hydrolase [Candidatus Wallbacteria bacterium]|mgnify:CR=1 FL=1
MAESNSMIVKYWGVRGSIPAPLTIEQIKAKEIELIQRIIKDGGIEKLFGGEPDPKKISDYLDSLPKSLSGTYGGDTTCIEIQVKDSPLIMIDAGTGARSLGKTLLGRLFSIKTLNPLNTIKEFEKDLHLFFTHYHWDHLQGFPFFAPGFLPGPMKVNIQFYGKRNTTQRLSEVLAGQQEYPNFPVVWDDMPCSKNCMELGRLEPGPMKIGNATICYQELTHPDSVFAYSVENNGKKFVCATDTEHKDSPDPRLIKLAQNADVLYYDTQYLPEEYKGGDPKCLTGALTKFDWGHSTYEWGIKNALAANVSTLVLGHHEPFRDDFQLEKLYERSLIFRDGQLKLKENEGKKLEIILGYEGLTHAL